MHVINRPVNLNLLTISFPITAIISILHRVSGVVIFLSLPILLYWLTISLRSPFEFYELQNCFHDSFLLKAMVHAIIAAVVYHLVAGLRHLSMDFGFGETFKAATYTSWFVLIASAGITMYTGYWLWQ